MAENYIPMLGYNVNFTSFAHCMVKSVRRNLGAFCVRSKLGDLEFEGQFEHPMAEKYDEIIYQCLVIMSTLRHLRIVW